jgi:hypothetical protein
MKLHRITIELCMNLFQWIESTIKNLKFSPFSLREPECNDTTHKHVLTLSSSVDDGDNSLMKFSFKYKNRRRPELNGPWRSLFKNNNIHSPVLINHLLVTGWAGLAPPRASQRSAIRRLTKRGPLPVLSMSKFLKKIFGRAKRAGPSRSWLGPSFQRSR